MPPKPTAIDRAKLEEELKDARVQLLQAQQALFIAQKNIDRCEGAAQELLNLLEMLA